MGKYRLGYNDYNREQSIVTVQTIDLTSANFLAQEALRTALKSAIDGITIGVVSLIDVQGIGQDLSQAPAASPLAQREIKWTMNGETTVGQIPFSRSIPLADLTLLATNSDYMDDTSGEYTALETAYNALVYYEDASATLNNIIFTSTSK